MYQMLDCMADKNGIHHDFLLMMTKIIRQSLLTSLKGTYSQVSHDLTLVQINACKMRHVLADHTYLTRRKNLIPSTSNYFVELRRQLLLVMSAQN